MSATLTAEAPLRPSVSHDEPVQRWARATAILLLLSLVAGGFGEGYAPAKLIVANDAAATARNILAFGTIFRVGFAIYLVEAVCDVALALLFYLLLRPAGHTLALFTAFLGLMSTALYAVAEACYFAPSLVLSGASYLHAFSPDQLNALSLLSLALFNRIAGTFLVFYGLASVLRGYLIFVSGYLPRALGVLFILGGLGFIAQNFAIVLAPRFASFVALVPTMIAMAAMMVWLFAKGVDVNAWAARHA